ncbi:MAG: transcription termination/antitermination NusG family protein [Acidithiobacillus sp.]|jgi:transcription antitermination factor NusG|uniref:transcription termination/antitermination protein NusG n=1 Tax=Acidithiobacillus sp. TaxID=1872118 RepID=UPI00355F78E9
MDRKNQSDTNLPLSVKEIDDVANWYVLYVANGHEFEVSKNLERFLTKVGKRDRLEEIFIPISRIQVIKNRTFVTKEQCVYSGYIFILIKLDRILISQLPDIKFVFRILQDNNSWPHILKDEEIKKLKECISSKDKEKVEKTKSYNFYVGQDVKIISGLFTGIHGEIEHIKKTYITVSVYPFSKKFRSVKTDVFPQDLIPIECEIK